MMRIMFGAVLGLLAAYPALLAVVTTVVVTLASHTPVLAFAAGVILWPRITRTVRGWAR
ncbi:hypothetical protein ABZ504_03105 [Streptomyces mirabilis]|uniref:hypothetical protein n=1 Tax=Streptomyces mirabilis TaxID=68239 RepID=UPI003403D5B3